MSATTPHRSVRQGLLFHHLRIAILRNGWRQMLGQSMVRPLTIFLSSLFVAAFVFTVSFGGFSFLFEIIKLPRHGQIIEMLIGVLFFSLGFLLIFSGGLILHGSLFGSPETAFLLSKPVRADSVFAYKFQGAIGFSSWAFLLLGGPILIAYAMAASRTTPGGPPVPSPVLFYLVLPFFFLGFVLLPGSVGAILCFLIVNYLPQRRKQVLICVIVLVLGLLGWWIASLLAESRALGRSPEPFSETANQFLARISFARSLWLPSAWVARGLMAAGRGDLGGTAYYLALVWSNGLFFYLLAAWCSAGLYRRGYNRVATGGDLRKKHGGAWMDRVLGLLLPFVHPATKLLIVKDFRTFRRDPQQYGQVLLFTGLLALYFANIKRMFIREIEWPFQNSISFLNLCAIALLLSAYTGRFIYPLLSLEGRKFWILGLLPVRREQLLWGKFVFSLTGGLLLAESMLLLSDLMLEMPPDAVVLHALTVAVLAAGLSGLSVGLGAVLPNFRESDPSKIAVGFGGTVNLIVGLGFLLLVIGVMSGPWHLLMIRGSPMMPRPAYLLPVTAAGVVAGLVVGFLGAFVPLRLGIHALRRMEF